MTVARGAVLGGVVGALVGLGLGVVYAFGGLLIDLFTIGLNPGTWMAFGALIGMPVLFGGAGIVVGAVAAFVVDRLRGGQR